MNMVAGKYISPSKVEAIVSRVTGNPEVYVMVYLDETKKDTTFLMMAINHDIPSLRTFPKE